MNNITSLKSSDFVIKSDGIYIKNIQVPGMLLIRADWCGHCKKFYPTFKDISNQLKKDFVCADLEQSNISNELSAALKFQYFPTIKFFDQYGKIIGTYPDNKSRDKQEVLKYICDVYHHCIQYH